jgi:metal iron transporter
MVHIQVLAVFACFILLLVKVRPNWPDAFLGFVPSKALFDTKTDVLYTGFCHLHLIHCLS